VLVVFHLTSAPGNNSIFLRLNSLTSSSDEGWQALLKDINFNLSIGYTSIPAQILAAGLTTDHIQMAQLTTLVLAMLYLVIRYRQMAFHLYNLVTIFVAAIVLYLPGGYYRLLAPHILLTLLLLIASKRYALVGVVVLIGLLATGTFLNDYYRNWNRAFKINQPRFIDPAREPFATHLAYQPAAADPWCNTVLVPLKFLDHRVTIIPAGIGVSWFASGATLKSMPRPLKSLYLLLDGLYAEARDTLAVDLLVRTNLGTIYRNREALCS
jgi:hypothetical protein